MILLHSNSIVFPTYSGTQISSANQSNFKTGGLYAMGLFGQILGMLNDWKKLYK